MRKTPADSGGYCETSVAKYSLWRSQLMLREKGSWIMPATGPRREVAARGSRCGLTPQQYLFVLALSDVSVLSLKEAALRAGYSPRSAREMGSRLARNPSVVRELERFQRDSWE